MEDSTVREVAIAGHWLATDPTAPIYITNFDLKSLRVWTVMPGDPNRWREWGVKAAPMSDEMFGEINEALRGGQLEPIGTDVGKNLNGTRLIIRAFVSRERRGGREWKIHFDLPLPEGI